MGPTVSLEETMKKTLRLRLGIKPRFYGLPGRNLDTILSELLGFFFHGSEFTKQ